MQFIAATLSYDLQRISMLSPLCFWHFQEAPRPTSEIDSWLPKWFRAVSGYSEGIRNVLKIFRIIRRCSEVLEDVSEYPIRVEIPKYCEAARLRKPFVGRSKSVRLLSKKFTRRFPGRFASHTFTVRESRIEALERCSSRSLEKWRLIRSPRQSFCNLFANPFGKLSTGSAGWYPLNGIHCMVSTVWSPLDGIHCMISTKHLLSPLQNC